jgi:hypothetical protein
VKLFVKGVPYHVDASKSKEPSLEKLWRSIRLRLELESGAEYAYYEGAVMGRCLR